MSSINNKAESVIAHPTKNINAVRAQSQNGNIIIHIYNMDTKEKLVQKEMEETIKFWKWVNDNTLGIVGNKSIYHLNLDS